MSQLKIDLIKRFDVVEFLEEYRKFPCLWRKSDPDFKNRVKRDEAEKSLLQCFNFATTKELRQKIRSLRGTYNQERNKVRNSLGNGIDVYRPKLTWFDVADSFLRQNEEEIESESNLVTEEEDCLPTETEREEEITSPELPQSEPSTSDPLPVSNSGQHPTSQLHPAASQSPTYMNYTNRKRKREKSGPQNRRNFSQLNGSLENVLKEVALQSPSTNEFTIFGNHVASQLQALPLAAVLQLQADIQSLITSVRLEYLQTTSSQMSEQLNTNCSISEDSSHKQDVTPDPSDNLILYDTSVGGYLKMTVVEGAERKSSEGS